MTSPNLMLNALTGHRIPARGNAPGILWYTPLPRPETCQAEGMGAPHTPVDLYIMKHAAHVQRAPVVGAGYPQALPGAGMPPPPCLRLGKFQGCKMETKGIKTSGTFTHPSGSG